MKIYKYEITRSITELPRGAKVLKIAIQHNKLCVWAMIDPTQTHVPKIYTFTTGEEIENSDLFYRDTVLLSDGDFVLHIFEDRNV